MEEKKIRLSKEDYELLKEKLCDLSNTEVVVKLKDLFEEEKDYMEIPFDFDKAKNGDLPVKTKSGYDVRIICWNRLGEYPIVGLVKRNSDNENVVIFDRFGIPMNSSAEIDSLVCMVEKRKVWVSVYLDKDGRVQVAIPSEVNPGYKVLAVVKISYFPEIL